VLQKNFPLMFAPANKNFWSATGAAYCCELCWLVATRTPARGSCRPAPRNKFANRSISYETPQNSGWSRRPLRASLGRPSSTSSPVSGSADCHPAGRPAGPAASDRLNSRRCDAITWGRQCAPCLVADRPSITGGPLWRPKGPWPPQLN
jgi:hypothetical protein